MLETKILKWWHLKFFNEKKGIYIKKMGDGYHMLIYNKKLLWKKLLLLVELEDLDLF